MANFVKIGDRRVNLDLVYEVVEWSDGGITVYYSGDNTSFDGDKAKLLLMAIDGDDGEEFDALYEQVNAPKPETYGEYGGDVEPEPAGVIQTDEELAAADRDEIPW